MKILVINGPNLNLLGQREPEHYGSVSLKSIEAGMSAVAAELAVELTFFQSNHEGELVERIHQAQQDQFDGIVINPAAYGHTSVALRDAFSATHIPFVEIHISNIYAREPFRHKTLLSDIANGVVVGFGWRGYLLALRGLCESLSCSSSSKN